MQVRVVFLGYLRAAAGRRELDIELPEGAKISSLFDELSKMMPDIAQRMNEPALGNLIIVNGVELSNLKGMETPIVKDSEIVLVPVAHGGY